MEIRTATNVKLEFFSPAHYSRELCTLSTDTCPIQMQKFKHQLHDLVIGLYISLFILGDDALVQVYPEGIRHIRADKRVNEWKAPGKKTVMNCAVNRRQVVIALSGGELVYFEMDPVSLKQDYSNGI